MNEKLLDIAVCPVTHQDLRKADSSLIATLNAGIADGNVSNVRGDVLSRSLSGGLVSRDGQRFYPLYDGLVSLLEAESIALEP
ncbi:MAG: Trm112 family protein [Pseudomonadota bacterium]